jgi:hypothetical protein
MPVATLRLTAAEKRRFNAEARPRARLLTVDVRDFTIYRRRDGSPVPCIMPPSPGSVPKTNSKANFADTNPPFS